MWLTLETIGYRSSLRGNKAGRLPEGIRVTTRAMAPPARLELTHPASEAGALST